MYDVALGSAADVDKAVAAARAAFEGFAATSREERIALLGACDRRSTPPG